MTYDSKFSRLGDLLSGQPRPRCAAFHNDCGPDAVRRALDAVEC